MKQYIYQVYSVDTKRWVDWFAISSNSKTCKLTLSGWKKNNLENRSIRIIERTDNVIYRKTKKKL